MDISKSEESKEETNMSSLVKIIMNQTTYTEQEARDKLAFHNNDIYKTLREFMSIPEPATKKITSVNQTIYKEIRKNLGVVELNYDNIAKE